MRFVKLEPYYGMEYLTVYLPATVHPKYGDVVHAKDMGRAEMAVSKLLVRKRVPLRGIEVKFLRKTAGFTLRNFGEALGITHQAVMKWEASPKKRIGLINEVAVRSLMGELLNVKMDGRFSKMRPMDEAPVGGLEVKLARAS